MRLQITYNRRLQKGQLSALTTLKYKRQGCNGQGRTIMQRKVHIYRQKINLFLESEDIGYNVNNDWLTNSRIWDIGVTVYNFFVTWVIEPLFDYTSIISRDLKTSGYSAIDKSLPKRRNKSFFLPSDDSRYSFPMQFVFCVIDESTLRDEYIIITRCSKETNDRSQGRTTSTVKDPEQVRGRFLSLWPRINQTYTKELVKALTPPARLAFVNFSP